MIASRHKQLTSFRSALEALQASEKRRWQAQIARLTEKAAEKAAPSAAASPWHVAEVRILRARLPALEEQLRSAESKLDDLGTEIPRISKESQRI